MKYKAYVKELNIDEGRLFFVGDLHGELPTLLKGLSEVGFDERKDHLLCTGDLIDRGRYSLRTAECFINNLAGCYHTVLGNHDIFAITMYNEKEAKLWKMNGGSWAFGDFYLDDRKKLANGLKELPLALDVNYKGLWVGVVHACVSEDIKHWQEFINIVESGNDNIVVDATWNRNYVEYPDYFKDKGILQGVDLLIHGHSIVKNPLLVGNRYHIDTGLCYDKKLTIAELVDGELEYNYFKLDFWK